MNNYNRSLMLVRLLTLILAGFLWTSMLRNGQASKSSEKKILSFKEGPNNISIDEGAKKITWTVPGFVNLAKLAPQITVSDKATISPASGVDQDFTKPVVYKVTAEDGSTVTYTALVAKGADGPAGMGSPGGGRMGAPGGTSTLRANHSDIAYATKSPAQKLDIYLPGMQKGPFPVLVQIHGGAFKMGDKADGQVSASLEGLKRGYAVVSINYRLSSEAIFPAQIQDVKVAIRWIRANAKTYNLNPDKIATWGGSAGGNLAALAGTTGDVTAFDDASLGNANQSSRVQAVVDWFGPIQFDRMDAQFKASGKGRADHDAANSPESELIGKPVQEAADLVKRASPATYISKADPPFFIQHGTADPMVPTGQSVNFAADLEKVLGKVNVTYTPIEGAGHGGPLFSTPENLNSVFAFLDKYLK